MEEEHRWGLPGPGLEETKMAPPHSFGQNSRHSILYKHRMLGSVVPNKVECWEL